MARSSAASFAGIAGGFALFAHAMVQNSHAWPLLWAFLAGVLTVVLSRQEVSSAGPAIGAGALAGLIAGVIFLIATSTALFGLGVPEEAAQELKGHETAALLGFVVTAVIAIVAAVIGAALAYAIFGRRA